MKIAVLSGKGGTGKTFVTVNLAYANNSSVYIDCDVEEPNGHLFFKPKINNKKDVCVKIPVCNDDLCDGCKKCVSFCEFHALAYINNKLMLFDKICHSCGGCEIICPQKAISETD
ncbi:MAG: ATPase, partial [Clostridiaceae bacterium]|nr:ATPase [Clostridiaceae bacterium]